MSEHSPPMPGDCPTQLGGTTLHLCPERAAYRPDREEILVADVHLGKAAAFRRAGRPIPGGTTAHELERLDDLVHRKSARRLTVLGDLFHDAVDPQSSTAAAFRAWLDAHPALEVTLVRGNHDRHAADLIDSLPIHTASEPFDAHGLAYRHHPAPSAPSFIAGHIHPGICLEDAVDKLKVPVFWETDGSLILPAFGSFTGLQMIDPAPTDRLMAVTPTGVVGIANRSALRV